eukprot:6985555-Prymnesium_polylepis.2
MATQPHTPVRLRSGSTAIAQARRLLEYLWGSGPQKPPPLAGAGHRAAAGAWGRRFGGETRKVRNTFAENRT